MNNNINMVSNCVICHSLISDIKTTGKIYKTCFSCREKVKITNLKNKCEHNKNKSICILTFSEYLCRSSRLFYRFVKDFLSEDIVAVAPVSRQMF